MKKIDGGISSSTANPPVYLLLPISAVTLTLMVSGKENVNDSEKVADVLECRRFLKFISVLCNLFKVDL